MTTKPIWPVRNIYNYASVVQLHQEWPSTNTHQRMWCVKSLVASIKEVVNISFPAYESLYFTDAPIDSISRIDLVEGFFCIGPHCGAPAWSWNPLELPSCDERMSNRGPCRSITTYQFIPLIIPVLELLRDCSMAVLVLQVNWGGTLASPKSWAPSTNSISEGTFKSIFACGLIKARNEVIKKIVKSPIVQDISLLGLPGSCPFVLSQVDGH